MRGNLANTQGRIQGGQLGGDIKSTIGTKGANFARFWSILEEVAPPCPLLDLPLNTCNNTNIW